MGKPTWEDINKKLGKKIYNINDEEQIDSCINELVVRHYLELLNFVNVTKLDKIEPETIKKYIDGTYNDTEYIRNKFEDVKYDIEEFIRNNNINKVELYIERGQDVVAYQIHKISNSNDRNDALKMVRDIFSLVDTMHANFIVHSDLKPHNLMYCTRNGNDTLVLNDFDVSFVLPTGYPSRSLDVFGVSVMFAAPEQFGIHKNDSTIGYATDVFSAALISYIVLNQGIHPVEYRPDGFDTTNRNELEKNIRRMFEEMAKGSLPWTPPRYGSDKIKGVILQAMDIDKTKRYTAKQVLDAVNDEINAAPELTPLPTEPTPASKNKKANKNKKIKKLQIFKKIKQDVSGNGNIVINAEVGIIAITAIIVIISVGVYSFSNFISSGNNSGVTPNPNTVAATTDENASPPLTTTTDAPLITTVDTTEAQEDKTTAMPAVTTLRTTNDGQDDGKVDPPKPPVVDSPVVDPPVEEPSLYSYIDSPYNDGIILTGFGRDFTDAVLEIPEEFDGRTVTGIAEKAFTNNEYIKEIHIPDIVDSIDIKAFYNLYNLERVYLGRGITMIGEQAFFADRCNKRIFYFSQYDWNSVLYGDYCLGAEGEYEIEYQNLE